MKITAKSRDTEHLRFEDTKRIMSPEKFRDFRETGPKTARQFYCQKSPVNSKRLGWHIDESTIVFWAKLFEAGLVLIPD